ncbi:N-acetyl sugar amidotransferase [Candidatus Omnitrophota bacterium]
MRYCTRCVYPETSADGMTFDEKGVCSGCRVDFEKESIDWSVRKDRLKQILEKYRSKDNSNYDCIIPISGGKDSHFQVYTIKEDLGLNPLLVTFNHTFNTRIGINNLTNLLTKFGCDHIRFTPNLQLIRKLSINSLKKMGDMCWHCHSGIYTYPVQIAVKFNIPLIIWGEIGKLDLSGMYSLHDMVEMTRKARTEHGLRGYDASDLVNEEIGITKSDLRCFEYPSDEEIERVNVRGIYLGNYINWNAKKQAEMMIERYGFQTAREDRTFNTYENVECHHCGGAHDWLKYLKFGYGRATDHASLCIRQGIMTREEGIDMVKKFDGIRPRDIDTYLKWAGMTEEEFEASVENMRDARAWKRTGNRWALQDHVDNHRDDPHVDEVRLPIREGEKKDFILTCKCDKFEGGYVPL